MANATATRATSATVEVPAVGGDVEVQPIPPKILAAKAIKGGQVDFVELMVWKLVYGIKAPSFTEAEVRKITRRWTLRTLQPILDRIDALSGTDEHLRHGGRDLPHPVRKFIEPMVTASAWLQRFPDVASKAPRGPRARGAGRPAARRTTSASRDGPGDDGESSEPPPAGRRYCACECGADIGHRAPQARYLNDAHAAADRQRRKRKRDWAKPAATDVELAAIRCRCSPKRHLVDQGGCVQCGRPRQELTPEWVTSRADLRARQLAFRSPQREWRTSDGKRYPKREFVDESIVEGVAA